MNEGRPGGRSVSFLDHGFAGYHLRFVKGLPPLPGIKGEARRAAPDLPPGGRDLSGCQQKFGGIWGGIKRLKHGSARHPEVGRCPVWGEMKQVCNFAEIEVRHTLIEPDKYASTLLSLRPFTPSFAFTVAASL